MPDPFDDFDLSDFPRLSSRTKGRMLVSMTGLIFINLFLLACAVLVVALVVKAVFF